MRTKQCFRGQADFRRMSVPVGSFGHSERVPTADNSYRGIAETLAAKLFELSKSVGDARNPGRLFCNKRAIADFPAEPRYEAAFRFRRLRWIKLRADLASSFVGSELAILPKHTGRLV
jgi:hypothetical protein